MTYFTREKTRVEVITSIQVSQRVMAMPKNLGSNDLIIFRNAFLALTCENVFL